MNDIYKKLFFIFFCLFCMLCAFSAWAVYSRTEALGELAGSAKLVERYRSEYEQAERSHRELALRLERVQDGLGELREIADGSVNNIRAAIALITGVKSILEKMEDGGLLRDTAGAGGGAGNRPFNRE